MYTKITPKFCQEFLDLVNKSSKILITSHTSPDDDAISSTMATKYALETIFPSKNIDIWITGNKQNRYRYFEKNIKINFAIDISKIINKYDTVIFLDGSQYHRFTKYPEILATPNKTKICIDHHKTSPDDFNLIARDHEAVSTAQLIYQLFDGKIDLNKTYAEVILLGILGDTGNLLYVKPNQTSIFALVQKLLEVSNTEIQELKSKYSLLQQSDFEIIQELIKNSQFHHIKNWPNFQTSYIDTKYINNHNYNDNQVNSAVDIFVNTYLRWIKNHPWGFVARPQSDGSTKISFRSLPGYVNVRRLAETMGIGGGHDQAAGASIKNSTNTKDVIKKIISWIKYNQPDID